MQGCGNRRKPKAPNHDCPEIIGTVLSVVRLHPARAPTIALKSRLFESASCDPRSGWQPRCSLCGFRGF
jgi:hypothetical protein